MSVVALVSYIVWKVIWGLFSAHVLKCPANLKCLAVGRNSLKFGTLLLVAHIRGSILDHPVNLFSVKEYLCKLTSVTCIPHVYCCRQAGCHGPWTSCLCLNFNEVLIFSCKLAFGILWG